jgi:hypothetical protein
MNEIDKQALDDYLTHDPREDSPEENEPRPPDCICCEYMHVCEKDRETQKPDYCPDPKYRKWYLGELVPNK